MEPKNRTPRLLLAEALALIILARIAVALLPFRALLRLLVRRPAQSVNPHIVPHVCHAVSRVANFPLPWAVCLPQAIAAHWMLARRGIPTSIKFGVRTSPETLKAHAWLVFHGRHVLGHRAGLAYQPIFQFPPQGAA